MMVRDERGRSCLLRVMLDATRRAVTVPALVRWLLGFGIAATLAVVRWPKRLAQLVEARPTLMVVLLGCSVHHWWACMAWT
jgi:hypothetical protein